MQKLRRGDAAELNMDTLAAHWCGGLPKSWTPFAVAAVTLGVGAHLPYLGMAVGRTQSP